jgi:hypothetical protein
MTATGDTECKISEARDKGHFELFFVTFVVFVPSWRSCRFLSVEGGQLPNS